MSCARRAARLGFATLLLDIAQGRFRRLAGRSVPERIDEWMCLGTALAVMAGHAFPVFLKFKGGKAVASFVGAFLYLTPAAACG